MSTPFITAFLNLDFYSQQQQQKQQKQSLTLKHLDAALQDLDRVLTINPHNEYAEHLKVTDLDALRIA